MKKLIVIISLLSSITNLYSQFKNNISIDVGEIYLTDWKGRYGIQYGLSYSHVWLNHLSSSISTHLYTYHKSELLYPPRGYVSVKQYVEANVGIGYFLMPQNTSLNMHSEIGLNYRKRSEVIVVASGITTGGWAETLTDSYTEKDFGISFTFNINYLILSHLSFGIFSQFKFYPSETTLTYPEEIAHDSPNTISYGLSCGFNF